MKPKSPKSLELYDIMIKRGYPAEFCDQITKNLNTDWTAGRVKRETFHPAAGDFCMLAGIGEPGV